MVSSCTENANTTSFLDSSFGELGEKLGLDDHGDLGESTFTENLEVTLIKEWYIIIIYSFGTIDNRSLVLASLGLSSGFLWNDGPEFVEVDGWLVLVVSEEMEHSHTFLSEVPWMAVEIVRAQWKLTICSCWFSCDAYHQLYLYHLDAFCACQLYRDRGTRDLSTFLSSSTLQPKRIIFNTQVIYHFSRLDLINI